MSSNASQTGIRFCVIISGTARCWRTKRPLTRSLDLSEEGLAVKATPKRYRMVSASSHPLAGASGVMLLHRRLLFDRIGAGWHPCYWCGELVEWRTDGLSKGALVADHVDHDKLNNDPGNLVPSCNPCNAHRLSGETWPPWVPGTPTGEVNRLHARCRRGHLLASENVYIRPDTGRRQCRLCIQSRSKESYDAKTPGQHAADLARNRQQVPCPVCGESKNRGSMRRHIRAMHEGKDGSRGATHCADRAGEAGIPTERYTA